MLLSLWQIHCPEGLYGAEGDVGEGKEVRFRGGVVCGKRMQGKGGRQVKSDYGVFGKGMKGR